jgi:hypothetical protein
MMKNCLGCGAEVIWVKTITGRKKMPLDAEPVWVLPMSGGDTFVREDGSIIFGRKIGDAWDDDPDVNAIEAHESHFATCPVGGQFRNRKPRTRAPGYR